jgi:hypothetical protein
MKTGLTLAREKKREQCSSESAFPRSTFTLNVGAPTAEEKP